MTNVGTGGYYWSASANCAGNIYAGCLDFTSGNANPLNTGSRSIGRSVRCVQHLLPGCFPLTETPRP
ncbi:MAG: hypothetical protein K2J53_04445 [Alistipes sp.]|nr:hypothetical protein [Alistipes sp.]